MFDRLLNISAPKPQEWYGSGRILCKQKAVSIMDLQQCSVLRLKLETGAMAVDMRLGLQGRTMLHVAVLLLRPDLVELLLEFNADPLLEDSHGASPHSLALGLKLPCKQAPPPPLARLLHYTSEPSWSCLSTR